MFITVDFDYNRAHKIERKNCLINRLASFVRFLSFEGAVGVALKHPLVSNYILKLLFLLVFFSPLIHQRYLCGGWGEDMFWQSNE